MGRSNVISCMAFALAAAACGLIRLDRASAAEAVAKSDAVSSIDQRVDPQRLARLRRGINLSHWFAQVYDPKGYAPAHFSTFVTRDDLALIRSLGFSFVRLPVEPKELFAAQAPASLQPAYLAQLDAAIELVLACDLAVVVDVHPHPEFNKRLTADDARARTLIASWSSLARHLSRSDEDRVFLELLNEPTGEDRKRWADLQAELAAAVRAAAPRHTIIATGARWSGIEDLLALAPLPDRNIVYNFHFYEPGTFTHQGATWGYEPWKHCKNVPYPSTPQRLAPVVAKVTDEQAGSHLREYGEACWNAERVKSEIGRAAAWAQRHEVALICDEFGVYKPFAPPAERAAWIRDARAAFEHYGIGWAMWDYAGGFALLDRKDGRAVPDPAIVAALGLEPGAGGAAEESSDTLRPPRPASFIRR